MELAEEITIAAPLEKVYEGLNDIAILKACIPGCEELDWTSKNELEAKVTLKIGPVKAKFKGKVTLDTANAPKGFSLTGEGDGGLAGFAKGGADVELIADGDGTMLKYVATAFSIPSMSRGSLMRFWRDPSHYLWGWIALSPDARAKA